MLSRQLQADLWLALVTLIWGSTFVVVKNELAHVGPLAFVALRFAVALLAMAALTWRSLARSDRRSLAAGSLIGLFLFGGYALQTLGLRYTTAGKAAFITGLCVVLAPLFARLLLRHKPARQALMGVALATLGLALLSLGTEDWGLRTEQAPGTSNQAPGNEETGDWGLGTGTEGGSPSLQPPVSSLPPALSPQSPVLSPESLGDLLVLGCAACFAMHIVAISRFAPKMDSLVLTTVQIGTVALAGGVAMALLEPLPAMPGGGTVGVAALMGVVATAFAFTVQNRVQVFTTPTHTALVLSLEPVFGALFAYLLAGETLSVRQLVGCALILGGMVVAELRRGSPQPPLG